MLQMNLIRRALLAVQASVVIQGYSVLGKHALSKGHYGLLLRFAHRNDSVVSSRRLYPST